MIDYLNKIIQQEFSIEFDIFYKYPQDIIEIIKQGLVKEKRLDEEDKVWRYENVFQFSTSFGNIKVHYQILNFYNKEILNLYLKKHNIENIDDFSLWKKVASRKIDKPNEIWIYGFAVSGGFRDDGIWKAIRQALIYQRWYFLIKKDSCKEMFALDLFYETKEISPLLQQKFLKSNGFALLEELYENKEFEFEEYAQIFVFVFYFVAKFINDHMRDGIIMSL